MTYAKTGLLLLVQEVSADRVAVVKPTRRYLRRLLERAAKVLSTKDAIWNVEGDVMIGICAVLWAIGAPAFFFLPTWIDGLWERILGIIAVVWVANLSWLLLQVRRRGCYS